VAACVRADDPLAFGIAKLRHARATTATGIEQLDARRGVAERGLAVQLVQDDATSLALPSASFGFVHERTVLLNVAEPETVVAEMVRIARPGGVVALEEPDSANWLCDPPHPAFATLHEALLGAYRAAGKNFDQGRTVAS
jgi:ubiquinone/menaquinone biosynthesis C-methylase UbiE